jgi:hypothetical protein
MKVIKNDSYISDKEYLEILIEAKYEADTDWQFSERGIDDELKYHHYRNVCKEVEELKEKIFQKVPKSNDTGLTMLSGGQDTTDGVKRLRANIRLATARDKKQAERNRQSMKNRNTGYRS